MIYKLEFRQFIKNYRFISENRLITNVQKIPFLKFIVTGDEEWVPYNNVQCNSAGG